MMKTMKQTWATPQKVLVTSLSCFLVWQRVGLYVPKAPGAVPGAGTGVGSALVGKSCCFGHLNYPFLFSSQQIITFLRLKTSQQHSSSISSFDMETGPSPAWREYMATMKNVTKMSC